MYEVAPPSDWFPKRCVFHEWWHPLFCTTGPQLSGWPCSEKKVPDNGERKKLIPQLSGPGE